MVVVAALFFKYKLMFGVLSTLVLCSLLCMLYFTDKKSFTLPIKYNFGLLAVVLILSMHSTNALLGLGLGFLASGATYILRSGSMGLGDVVLLGSIGGILTTNYILYSILISSVMGFVYVFYKTNGKFSEYTRLPLGSFFIASIPVVGILVAI